jgi:hypothetical protein
VAVPKVRQNNTQDKCILRGAVLKVQLLKFYNKKIFLVGFRFGGGRFPQARPQPEPLPGILFSGSCTEESCFTELLEDAGAVLQGLRLV